MKLLGPVGIKGLFIGPAVVAVTIAVLDMLGELIASSQDLQERKYREQTVAVGAE